MVIFYSYVSLPEGRKKHHGKSHAPENRQVRDSFISSWSCNVFDISLSCIRNICHGSKWICLVLWNMIFNGILMVNNGILMVNKYSAWCFGTMEFYDFPILFIYWECHHPNWRTPWFFRGVGLNHQPVMYVPISAMLLKNSPCWLDESPSTAKHIPWQFYKNMPYLGIPHIGCVGNNM